MSCTYADLFSATQKVSCEIAKTKVNQNLKSV